MTPRNVIIIGSGPAGLTAALYTARANLQPLLIEGREAGGQLMLTTLVENYPGYRDGIMGPDLMHEMRTQAEKFGTEIIQKRRHVVELCAKPFVVRTADAEYTREQRDHRHRCVGPAARAAVRARADGPRRVHLRDVRWLLLSWTRNRGRRRRRLGDGRGGLPDEVRQQGDGRASPRDAARLEDHAGQGAREPEDCVDAQQRGRRHPRHGQGRGHVDGRPSTRRRTRSSRCR